MVKEINKVKLQLYELCVQALLEQVPAIGSLAFPPLNDDTVIFIASQVENPLDEGAQGVFGDDAIELAHSTGKIAVVGPLNVPAGIKFFAVLLERAENRWHVPEIVNGVLKLNADYPEQYYSKRLWSKRVSEFASAYQDFIGINETLLDDATFLRGQAFSGDGRIHSWLRSYVRALFASIEGFSWSLKRISLYFPQLVSVFSPAEQALLAEVSPTLNSGGKVRVGTARLDSLDSFRFAIEMAERVFVTSFGIDFGNAGWGRLGEAKKIRDRLMHPKRPDMLMFASEDGKILQEADVWYHNTALSIVENIRKRLLQLGWID